MQICCILVMSRYTENRTDIAVFNKTVTDTDKGIGKTENYRKPKKKPTIPTLSVFHLVFNLWHDWRSFRGFFTSFAHSKSNSIFDNCNLNPAKTSYQSITITILYFRLRKIILWKPNRIPIPQYFGKPIPNTESTSKINRQQNRKPIPSGKTDTDPWLPRIRGLT